MCHIEHETAPPFVAAPQLRTVPKIKCDISGRKPAQTRQKKKSGIFLGSSRPKHNHEARTDTAKHQCALIPTRRKMAIFPQGGQSTAPLARGRSKLVFTGPVGSSHSHARRSGRRLNPNHNTPDACVHGVVDVHSAVVRTTKTMAIHTNMVTYHQRRYLSTKRGSVFVAMRALGSWAAPTTCGRKRAGCRIAES